MKRIIVMLTVAAMLVAAIAVSAAPSFAAPCQNPNSGNPHCETVLPSGNAPNENSQACSNNPNCERNFVNPGQGH